MTFNWADKVTLAAPQSEFPRADGAAYRAMRRLESASGIYNELVVQPRPPIYEQVTPKTLADYGRPVSKYAQKAGESDHAFTARLRGTGLQHLAETLPPDELAAVAGEYNGAVTRMNEGGTGDHDQLRQQLDARQRVTGVDRGIIDMSPAQRAALVQQRPGAMADLDSRSTPMSPAAMRQAMHEREQAQRNAPPHRQEIPTASSGTGWMTR